MELQLETGPYAFSRVDLSWKDKAIILSWVAETEVPNIVAIKMKTIKLRWPPVRTMTFFTDRNDGE